MVTIWKELQTCRRFSFKKKWRVMTSKEVQTQICIVRSSGTMRDSLAIVCSVSCTNDVLLFTNRPVATWVTNWSNLWQFGNIAKWKCLQVRKMAASKGTSDESVLNSKELPEINVLNEDQDHLVLNLAIKCRGCLVENPEMHHLFTVFDQKLSLADILSQTTYYVVKETDGFPPYLCTKCTTTLIDFFNFKVQFQKTDLYMRTLLGKLDTDSFDQVQIKKEVFDTDTEIGGDNHLYDTFFGIDDFSHIACDICKVEYGNQGELDTHLAKEHGKNPFEKYALFKEKTIADEKEKKLMVRMKAIIERQKLEELPGKLCRICQKKFSDDDFQEHWDTHKVHACEYCGHRFIKKSDKDTHIQSIHLNERNFACTFCEKVFKTKQICRKHIILHTQPRQEVCEICGQRFSARSTLKTHMKLKHIRTREFQCTICGLAFPLKATLDKHVLRHNKNRPAQFFCQICTAGFKDRSSMKRHYLVKHSGDFQKPTCQFCGKSYCSNTKLKYHQQRHHSGVKFERKKRTSKVVTENARKRIKREVSSSSEDSNSYSDDERERGANRRFMSPMPDTEEIVGGNYYKHESAEEESESDSAY